MQEVYQHSSENSSADSDNQLHSPSLRGKGGPSDSIEIQAGRFRFHKPIPGGGARRRGGGIRGLVKEMSNASRRRFMQKMASLDYSALAEAGCMFHFVTLTTLPEFWENEKQVYKALRRFSDSLRYHASEAGYLGAFVRRELGGKNGMLHYHLVVIGGPKLDRSWLSSVWTRSLGASKPVMVHVSETTDPNRLAKYICKYCAKAAYEGRERVSPGSDSAEPETNGDGASLTEAHSVGNGKREYTGGRWWYLWGEDNLPWGELVTIEGVDARAISKRVRRIFRRWRVEKLRQGIDKQAGAVGFALRHFSLKQIAIGDRFGEYLRKAGGGFTVLVPPELLDRMVDCACIGEDWNRGRLDGSHVVV